MITYDVTSSQKHAVSGQGYGISASRIASCSSLLSVKDSGINVADYYKIGPYLACCYDDRLYQTKETYNMDTEGV